MPASSPPAPEHLADDTIAVRKQCVGPLENNVYVVECRRTGEGVVVDAAAEPARILASCEGVDIQAIVTTHGHWDHVGAAEAVARELDVPILVHPADAGDLPETEPIPEHLAVGDLRFEAVVVPGHTPGSTVLFGHGLAFTGDTLFPGGPGATSGPEAFARIMEGLRDVVFARPDDTLVLPGHGLDTTLGRERPHLDVWELRGR